MKIFNRGKKIVEANANKALDNMEDPVTMAKQAIVDMEEKIVNAMQSRGKVKAAENTYNVAAQEFKDQSVEWENRALALQKKLTDNSDYDAEKVTAIEGKMIECLNKVENLQLKAKEKEALATKQKQLLAKLDKSIKKLKENVEEYKGEITDLESRQVAADAAKDVNKELSDMGGMESANNLMKRMKAKVNEDEATADSFAELGNEAENLEDDIDALLAEDSPTENNELLAKFRKNNT